LEDLQKCFEKNGSLAGTLEFIVAIVCVVLSFYVALWLFWVVKQWSNLSSSCEQKMMEKLSTISSRDETPGNE
jgi:hypothetical protein